MLTCLYCLVGLWSLHAQRWQRRALRAWILDSLGQDSDSSLYSCTVGRKFPNFCVPRFFSSTCWGEQQYFLYRADRILEFYLNIWLCWVLVPTLGFPPVAVSGLLLVVASLAMEQAFGSCSTRAQELWLMGPRACRLR